MARLNVALLLDSPLLVGRPRQGDVYQSQGFLPGSVLRGAVAEALMAGWSAEQRAVAHPDACPDRAACPLCRVLYPPDGPPPRFGDCYPALSGAGEPRPFPLSAHTCKRHKGLRGRPPAGQPHDPNAAHGVFDTLVRAAAAHDAAESGRPLPYRYRPDCPVCGEETKPAEGAFTRAPDGYTTATPINRRFSRTAINRRRWTAQEGQLFTLTVMGERMGLQPAPPGRGARRNDGRLTQSRTSLVGAVETGAADAAALTAAMRSVPRLGSAASRGLGWLAGVDVAPAAPLDPLAERVARFNDLIRQERAFYDHLGVAVLLGRWYFCLDLLSATYLRRGGLPTLCPTAEMLALPGATLCFAVVEPLERGGWVNAWGLPRERRLGAAPGSVFLYRVDGPPGDEAALYQRLAELERLGLGDDTERGAGQVRVCDLFHGEVNPQ